MQLFGLDSKFYRVMSRIADFMILSVLWIVFSLPVVTCGAASAALYYAVHKILRDEGLGTVKEFWRGFRMNWKQATAVWLLALVLAGLAGGDLFLIYYFQGASGWVFKAFCLLAAVLLAWTLFWFPYVARFENKTGLILKNSFILLATNLGASVLLLADFAAATALAAVFFLCYFPLMPLFVPALYAVFANMILEKIFAKYIPKKLYQ